MPKKWCQDYVQWYNHDHHHSALAGYTPSQVYTGDYLKVAERRQQALASAYEKHPERFIKENLKRRCLPLKSLLTRLREQR